MEDITKYSNLAEMQSVLKFLMSVYKTDMVYTWLSFNCESLFWKLFFDKIIAKIFKLIN